MSSVETAGRSPPFPPIFVISLKRSGERRDRIARQLDALGLPWRFWDAVDGKTLDRDAIAARDQTRWWRVYRGRTMNRAEIGCYLSHYGVWEHVARENMAAALILEDDTVLQDDFEAVARALMNGDRRWDVTLLSAKRNYRNHLDLGAIGDTRHRLVRFNRRVGGCGGYLITPAGARKLLPYALPIRAPVDWTYAEWWRNGLDFHAVLPAVVRYADVNALPSLINTESRRAPRNLREHLEALRYRLADARRLRRFL